MCVVNPDYYADCEIEPIDYIRANNLGYCEGNVIKYVTRWRRKAGADDLRKAKRYLEMLLEDLEDHNRATDAQENAENVGVAVSALCMHNGGSS